MKRREAHQVSFEQTYIFFCDDLLTHYVQLMVLLLGTGFTVIALLFMFVIFPTIVTETYFTYISRFYFPAFFGLINVFLMTLLHNNSKTDRTARSYANSSVMAGSSNSLTSSLSSYTTR